MPHYLKVTQKLYVKCYICSSSTLSLPKPIPCYDRKEDLVLQSFSRLGAGKHYASHQRNHRLLDSWPSQVG